MSLTRAPGRPRDPAVREAIALACRELIGRVGYSGLTIEAVAERAKVGRPTVYRRWPSKAHLVWDVLFTTPPGARVIGDTPDLRADVELWIRATVSFFALPEVSGAFPGLLDERPVDAAWYERLRAPAYDAVQARLRRGVAEGDIRPEADLDAAFDLVTAVAIYWATVPQPSGWAQSVEGIADIVLRGIRTGG